MPVTSHQPLATPNPYLLIPAFKLFWVSLSRIVIPSEVEGSFLHCGQYRMGTGRESTPCCYVFLLSHMNRLSVYKKDFSTSLEMTIRVSCILKCSVL